MRTPQRHFIEILESRIAPAGVVTVVTGAPGEFTLNGDGMDNQISIFQTAPGNFRIEGLTGTTLNPGGVLSLDITTLTKLTFIGFGGADSLTIANVATLTNLFVDGGDGSDTFTGINLGVTGKAEFSGGDGFDQFNLDGLTTDISGNLKFTDSAAGCQSNLLAEKTTIGGSVIVAGGTGGETLLAASSGTLSIGKGIDFDSGTAGAGTINFIVQVNTTIGTLSTSESVLMHGTDGGSINFSNGKVVTAGGIRMNGGSGTDQVTFTSTSRNVILGKLSTGESIKYDGAAGADFLTLQAKNISLAGGIDFNAGAGGTSMNLSSPNGKVTIGKLSTGQSIKFTGGVDGDTFMSDVSDLKASGGIEFIGDDGSNTFTLSGVNGMATIGRLSSGAAIKYTGGSGDDSATLTIASLSLLGGIDFAGGDGANTLTENAPNGTATIGKLSTSGASIKYTGGSGTDSISTTNVLLHLTGGIDFSGGAAASMVTLTGPNGKLFVGKLSSGQSVKYVGGADADQFSTSVSSASFLGGIEYNGDDGANSLSFGGNNGVVNVGKLTSGQSFLYNGGGGGDSLTSGQAILHFAGGIDFTGGNGSNTINFDTSGKTKIGIIGSGQSIKYTGGNDNDTVFIGGPVVTLIGSVEMNGDTGNNTIDFDGAHTGIGKTAAGVSILLNGGAGQDRIDLEDTVTLAGSLTLNGAADADVLDLTNINRLNVGGAVTFDGNAGNDNLLVDAFSLLLAHGLNYTGGDDTDDFSLVANGKVFGDVVVNLGNATAADQAATLTSHNGLVSGLALKGALNITGTGTAASTDTLTISNIAVAKALTASLGAGVSTVVIDNLRARDTFTVATGDGADFVLIERNNLFGNSSIAKMASIQTGNDADTVNIGDIIPPPNGGVSDSTRVRFLGGLTVDGGAGADSTNNIAGENDFPGGPPNLINI